MKRLTYIIIGVALLLASCGRQQQAKSVVKDFMKENLANPSALDIDKFSPLDSTLRIGDSLVTVMRRAAEANQRYKRDISYAEGDTPKKLLMTRVSYKLGDETCQDTYYLDEALSRVVAFKTNE